MRDGGAGRGGVNGGRRPDSGWHTEVVPMGDAPGRASLNGREWHAKYRGQTGVNGGMTGTRVTDTRSSRRWATRPEERRPSAPSGTPATVSQTAQTEG